MIFEMALIALYLGLVLGMKKHSARGELPKEYHILLMVLIVVASVAVCYALVRVCVVFSRPVEGRKTVEDVESQQQEQQQQQQQQRRRRDMRAAAAAAAIVVEHYQPHVNHQHATPPPVYGSWRHS